MQHLKNNKHFRNLELGITKKRNNDRTHTNRNRPNNIKS